MVDFYDNMNRMVAQWTAHDFISPLPPKRMPNTGKLNEKEFFPQILEEQGSHTPQDALGAHTSAIQVELDHLLELPSVPDLEGRKKAEEFDQELNLPSAIGSEEAVALRNTVQEESAFLRKFTEKLLQEMTKERFIPEWIQNMAVTMVVTAALAYGVHSGKLKEDTLEQMLKASFAKIEHSVQ